MRNQKTKNYVPISPAFDGKVDPILNKKKIIIIMCQ